MLLLKWVVATKPAMDLISECGGFEMVLLLSKSKKQGLGGARGSKQISNINMNISTYSTKDEVYEARCKGISNAQKVGG